MLSVRGRGCRWSSFCCRRGSLFRWHHCLGCGRLVLRHSYQPLWDRADLAFSHGEEVLRGLGCSCACLVAVEHASFQFIQGDFPRLSRWSRLTPATASTVCDIVASRSISDTRARNESSIRIPILLQRLHLLLQFILLTDFLLLRIPHQFAVHFAPVLRVAGLVRFRVPVGYVALDVAQPDVSC